MKDFITKPCFIGFLGSKCNYIPPEPPAPTAFDRIIPEVDGLDDYETTFETVVPGGVIIGIAGRNNSQVPVEFTVEIDNSPVQVLATSTRGLVNSGFTYIAAVEDLPIGEHTIKIVSSLPSSSGVAALRIVETDPLPNNWLGNVGQYTVSGTSSASGVVVGINDTTANSLVISITAWNDKNAFEPTAAQYTTPTGEITKIREDLIDSKVAVGFWRSSTVIAGRYNLRFYGAQTAQYYSTCMVELKGVTLRP